MNQILSTEMNKNKSKNKNSKPIEIKKIVLFFAIIIVLFGVVLLAKGVYSTIINSKNKVQPKEDDDDITSIFSNNIQQLPDDNYVETNSTVPDVETPTETSNIKIDYVIVGSKVKIVATDTNNIAYLTYKWNSEQSVKVDMKETSEDKTKLEVEIEIPEGLNTLSTIVTNENGQMENKKHEIMGIAAPKVTVQQDGEYLIINVKDENVVTLLNFTLNGQAYRINLTAHDADYYNAIDGLTVKTNSNNQIIEMEYRQLMTEKGENILTLTAENKRDAKATFEGKCTNP